MADELVWNGLSEETRCLSRRMVQAEGALKVDLNATQEAALVKADGAIMRLHELIENLKPGAIVTEELHGKLTEEISTIIDGVGEVLE